jgi:hypothetical protein
VLQDLDRTPTRMMPGPVRPHGFATRNDTAPILVRRQPRAARKRLGTARLPWALTGSGAVYDSSEPQLS